MASESSANNRAPAAFAWLTHRYGVSWGPLVIERIHSEAKDGIWLDLFTKRQRLSIRVTRTGFIRASVVHRNTGNKEPTK